MKIVILDGYAANPGDLSWAPLKALGALAVHDRTPAGETVVRAAGADVLLTNKVVLSADVIEQLPDLKFICILATGVNVVDLDAAATRGIPVANIPAYSTMSVAQTVFAHLLNFTHHVADHSSGVHAGRWVNATDFAYWDSPLTELDGKTMGLLGLGTIGTVVKRIALAMGMRVIAHKRTPDPVNHPDVEFVSLDALFAESDVLSLHCPLTPETEHVVNAERLKQMKCSAYLINTGRGPLLDEAAVAVALNDGQIAGVGVDVLSTEPPTADNPMLTAANCSITPHYAWASTEARTRLVNVAVANVAAFANGTPRNVVNGIA